MAGPEGTSLGRLRPTLFAVLAFTFAALGSYPFYQGALPEAHATSVNISLVANANGWNYSQPSGKNPTITVRATDNVFISFTASDALQHRFFVNVTGSSLPPCSGADLCSAVFNSTNPTTYGWASGVLNPGTYNYYDTDSRATTNGTLIVVPGPYPATVDIWLTATGNGWNYSRPSGTNPAITVYTGQTVNIYLNTTDPPGTYHRFYIDVDKNGVPDCSTQDMCSGSYDSTVTTVISWIGGTIPAGSYHYYDSYNQAVSNGTFIVRTYTPSPDYSLSASPSSLTIRQGTSQTSTITVASQNNYTGTVSLTANPTGVTATFNPASVSPPKNGIATSKLNITAPPSLPAGSYQVAITASNGTTQRSTTVNVQVTAPDFTLSINTNTLNTIQGSSSTATITITSRNGFSGRVSLKDQVNPSGPTMSLNSPTVNIASGGSQTSNLTITTTPTTQAGSYTITVTGNSTGTNGPLTHTSAITVDVNPPPVSPPVNNPPISTFLFEALAGIIVAVSLVIIVAKHRSTKKRSEVS